MSEKIFIGSDHGGFKLKQIIKDFLIKTDREVSDEGCFTVDSCDYPVIAKNVSEKVISNNARGILVCGTGIGMSIAANRKDGIRASVCTDIYMAKMTRKHNNSNILCLGERVIKEGLALEIVDTWLKTEFEGGRHQKRIDLI